MTFVNIFSEWKEKLNFYDNETDDTVSFNMKNKFIFNKKKSFPLTGEEIITMPHPIIQFTAISIQKDKAPMLPLVLKALIDIFNATSPYITAPFMDIFFRGIPINCGLESYEANAFCVNFHSGDVKGSTAHNDTFFKFGLLSGVGYFN